MMTRNLRIALPLVLIFFILAPDIAHASVDTSLDTIADYMMKKILPAVAIIGILVSCYSFVSGNPNARNHFVMVIIGTGIGYAAKAIIGLIQTLVH